ncbi:hypothetical protein MXL46_20895 [Heyndrickxia sporothermodurans]|uniref:Uncharacterized protein n=1 Tax=Heyndrickxia sporothermodurans TaxID=46224 RepID=A0A150KKI3_9BACI|nr:hypothetical protein [Heyndrickxia sporothermodurans]KYC85298.1 hypothetical protein B4102_4130 [Heyndrickxia sporothermodurans]MBL5768791.1 hypothetical protein [Heyndrickxia sporothermodurans]MBL5771950.1 hypothetical protein [Heyndrickxia sporothermodurans]MBL5775776.1 hypothetical protein [Heyndrickxia sporothermodurans]MBL5779115.1 hypothetical protein [Heyndrickxia sporothermodurans]
MTGSNKMRYNDENVILVASEPSGLRRKRTRDRMKDVKNSSQAVLKTLNEINETYTRKPAGFSRT